MLGRIADEKRPRREGAARIVVAVSMALGLHLLLFQLMMFETPVPFEVEEDFIAVELVTFPPKAQTIDPVVVPPEINEAPLPPQPSIKPAPKAAPPPAPVAASDAPNILSSTQRATAEDAGNTVPIFETGTTATPSVSERSAEDIRIDAGLKSMAADLTCLNGFSAECAEIRKDVFEDYQMSETDKVYTKKYAHTGMPAEFYGMSERAIRAKLNVPNAGENGLYIPFTNIGIDGGIWDAMNGVNKGCEWKMGADLKTGRQAPIKDCPGYLPAAKEDRDRRNKFLRVNE
ncbi:MAG: hypothetical protein ABJN69_08400 [Hellea sp.]